MNDKNAISRRCGRINGLYGDVLQGWALDPTNPELRLVVEIFIDGHSVALAKANEFNPRAEAGDEFNGFTVQLRESWLLNAKHISARIANHDGWLEGALHLPTLSPATPAPAASQVWHTGGLKISGWAFDPTDPNRAVAVTVRKGTEIVATATADRLHHALMYKASRHHGFEIGLPWSLADGEVHELEVYDDLGHTLSGSPLTLCCWPEGVEALLRTYTANVDDSKQIELLAQVARHQEHLLPKSADFSHYAEWFEVFQRSGQLLATLEARCGVLIISGGNTEMDAASVSSVLSQRYPAHAIEVTEASDVLPGLKRLIEQHCECIIPIISGDQLAAHALDHLIPLLEGDAAWAYGDCDCDGPDGKRSAPWLKPVWDIDLFIGADIFSPGAVFTRNTLEQAVDLTLDRFGSDCLNWHTLLAGVALLTEQNKSAVIHLPKVLYHRHSSYVTSPAQGLPSKERELAMCWLADSLAPGATVKSIEGFPGLLRAHWPLPAQLPLVSIMIPTRDQVDLLRTCIEGLLSKTDYPNLEIIIIDNQSAATETLTYLTELKKRGVVILPHPHPFNYAAVNNRAAEIAKGDVLCLLNNDIEILCRDWLTEMVSILARPDVDVVGAKLLWANMMVQHGGVVTGINRLAAHVGNTLEAADAGYLGLNQLTHQTSAVTGACMLMSKDLYLDCAGMNESLFPVAFNDVDLCMRIIEDGKRILWSANAKLIHAESASRGKDITIDKISRARREQENFSRNWFSSNRVDRHYHPALSLDYLAGPYGGLAMGSFSSEQRR